jgi:hypothetical protein
LPNTFVVSGESNYPYSAAADVVLTDGISAIYEVQFQSTPIVYVERIDHVPFSNIGEEWLQGVHRVNDLETALAILSDLIVIPDELAGIQRRLTASLIGGHNPAELILQDVIFDFEESKK